MESGYVRLPIIKTLFQTKWKTLAKQIFGIEIYSNTVFENNFSIHLNTSLKNTEQKTATKHTLYGWNLKAIGPTKDYHEYAFFFIIIIFILGIHYILRVMLHTNYFS